MNDLRNPYIAGAPVVETSMFFGREDVFRWIETSLTGKYVDHILVLHGQRRVGKTSVLKQIPNFLPPQYIQVFFDLQGRTNTTLDRFLWWMASEIVRTLKKEYEINMPRPKRDSFADPDAFITEFIPTLQEVIEDKVLLLTFDEFDTLDRADIEDGLTTPLIGFLRRLFEVEGFNFIFSIGSSGNKLENMQASYTDFFKTALYRKVSFLTKDDCHNLITKPVEGIITYQPSAIDRIIANTSGHPYFTQLTCHELFSRCQKTGARTVTPEDVEDIIDDVIERGTVNLKFVWDEASDLEKWTLAALGHQEGVDFKVLGDILKDQGVRFVEADLNSAILHLRDKDVLTQENCFVIHLMKRWLEINRPMERVREELVQTNPIANRFIEIGDEYAAREQFNEALENYQRALEIQNNNISALFNIGSIYLDQHKFQQAAASFEKALIVDDENIAARQGYCQAQLAVGASAQNSNETSDAVEAYQAILNINPVHAEARQNLADIYQSQAEAHLTAGNDQQALKSLRIAMEMTPEDKGLSARYQQIIDEKKAALVNSWLEKAEKALKRKRWDEAARMAEEALTVDPADQSIQAKVAEIKDAPRKEKLNAYKDEAKTAIARGNYEKAISALELAILLAPEDNDLAQRLESVQFEQLKAQLKHLQNRAQQAIAVGNWDAAIKAQEEALQLDPDNQALVKALAETKAAQRQARLTKLREQSRHARSHQQWEEARQAVLAWQELEPEDEDADAELKLIQKEQHQAQIKAYHQQAQAAQEKEDWEAAVTAIKAAIKLEPDDENLVKALADTKAAWKQFRLDQLAKQAEDAVVQERWSEAVTAWESYLAENPKNRAEIESRLDKARKYARLSADYTAAQDFMRKKQYNRAINLLQGIIAEDPAYKSTTRLLVEAVEANRQRTPIWRSRWLYAGLLSLLVISLAVFFHTQIIDLLSAFPWQASTADTAFVEGSKINASIQQNEQDPDQIFTETVLDYVETTPPTFEDDFSTAKEEWGTAQIGDVLRPVSDFIEDETLKINAPTGTFPRTDIFTARDFAISYKILSKHGNPSPPFFMFFINSTGDFTDNMFLSILSTGSWQVVKQNTFEGTYLKLDEGMLQFEQTNEILLARYGTKLVIFFNNELISVIDVDKNDGDQNRFRIVSTSDAFIFEIDDLRFWNLDEVHLFPEEFSDPILAHVTDQPPTLEDAFTTPKADWGLLQAGDDNLPVMDFVKEGALQLTANNKSIQLPLTPLLNARDFVLEFEFDPVSYQSSGKALHIGSRFRAAQNGETYYSLMFYPDTDRWQIVEQTAESQTVLDQGGFDGSATHQVRLVVSGEYLSAFLDDERISYLDKISTFHQSNTLICYGEKTWQVNIDDLHFWNLDGVEIADIDEAPSNDPTIETSQPVTTTPEQPLESDANLQITRTITNYMSDHPPTFEDDFSRPSNAWQYEDYSDSSNLRELIEDEQVKFTAPNDRLYFDEPHISEATSFILSFDFSPQSAFSGFYFNFGGYRFAVSDLNGNYRIENSFGGADAKKIIGSRGKLDSSEFYKIVIYLHNEKLAVFWDNDLIHYDEDFKPGTDSNFFEISDSIKDGYSIIFDNFRLWNLEGVFIDENTLFDAIFSYSDNAIPTFEDDFSTPNNTLGMAWTENSRTISISEFVEEGRLRFPSSLGTIAFPEFNLLNASDFILSFEFAQQPGFNGLFYFFRSTASPQSDYLFAIDDSRGNYRIEVGEQENYRTLESGSMGSLGTGILNHIIIFAKGESIGIFWDGELIYYEDNVALTGNNNQFIIWSHSYIDNPAIDFDNFRFWNLDGVELLP